MDDLRRNFEKQVTVYRVQQDEVGQKLQITEEEARQYYLGAPGGVRRAADGDAARDLDRHPDLHPGRSGWRQRRAGRCGAEAGAKAIRAPGHGGRGLRQGRVGGVGVRRRRPTVG